MANPDKIIGGYTMESKRLKCYFCGSEKIRVPSISIALSLSGDDYCFCEKCLKGMSADEFWEEFFTSLNYPYPPKLMSWAQDAIDNGIDIEEARWPIITNKTPQYTTKSKKPRKPQKERSKMTNSLRYKIMRRDSFQCVLCGATGKDDVLVVDHIKAIVNGGKTTEDNLRTLCQTCNSGKGARVE